MEDGLGTEELDAEVNRLLQSIGLQNSEIEPNLPDGNPQTAVPETSNPGPPVPGRQPASAWYRGQYPLHQALSSCQQADRSRREKDKEWQIRDKELPEKWPRVDGDAELQLLYEGIII